MFTYRTWVYYIRISITGIKEVAFHGGKIVPGKITEIPKKPSKSKKNPKKKGNGKTKGKGKGKPKGKSKGTPKGKGKGKPKGKGKGKPKGKGKGTPKGKDKGKPKGKGKGKPKGKGKGKPISGTWIFQYPGMTFKFVISHGHITINKRPIRLVPSNNKKFPTAAGWLMFTYRTWVYYIRISITGIKVVAFHGGKIVLGKVTGKVKKPKGK